MVDPAARAAAWPWIVDAGRRTTKGNSGGATGRFVGCRSGAARHVQAVVGVVGSAIYFYPGPTQGETPPGIVPGTSGVGSGFDGCSVPVGRPSGPIATRATVQAPEGWAGTVSRGNQRCVARSGCSRLS